MERGKVCENSIVFTQLFYEPETALINKIYFLKNQNLVKGKKKMQKPITKKK